MQRTIHHRYLKDVRPRIHTRLVFADVGRKLIDYKDSRELVTVMRDAILGMVLPEYCQILKLIFSEAHHEAWANAEILHRDISPNNIVILDQESGVSRGLLIDWDLCKRKSELNQGASSHSRSVSIH